MHYLRTLAEQESAWMKRMVGQVARRYGVDADDLMQEILERLIHTDVEIRGVVSMRSWLARMASWRAADMLRRQRRERVDSLVSMDATPVPDPVASEPAGPDFDWTIERLRHLGLRHDEAQVLLLILWGVDMSLRDFAEQTERSYAKTRKDRERGLRKIQELFELTNEETAAFITHRRYGTVESAATRLGIDVGDCRLQISAARDKIAMVLGDTTDTEIAPQSHRRPGL
jgi:RNA polymerase sigma factor (sigma-70 family)